MRRRVGRFDIAAHLSCLLLAVATFLLACQATAFADDKLIARSFRIAADASRARIVLHFDREPQVNWFLLRGPHRLVIDLPETGFAIKPENAQGMGLLTDVQFGHIGPAASRLILTADTAFEVKAIDVVRNEDQDGYRLVADLAATSEAAFVRAMANQALTTASTQSTPKGDRVNQQIAPAGGRFTVVIDPGHGGIDSGAEGISGTLEKSVTLAFSKQLKARLEKTGRFVVHLTREKDEFLRLDERVRIARQNEADLFISVHADTIKYRSVRGATVYTVSDQASDAEAAALAARENLADELAGLSIDDKNHEVSDILMDLIRRETHSFSIRFARTLVGELSSNVELIKNPHRFAGFRVLKAPDVPSVLLELGYLSNPDDEELLLDGKWRAKAVDSIFTAIDQFAGLQADAGR